MLDILHENFVKGSLLFLSREFKMSLNSAKLVSEQASTTQFSRLVFKKGAIGGENKKENSMTMNQVHSFKSTTTWLQLLYCSLLWGDGIGKSIDFENPK